jgi:hypothetical protein
MTKIIIMLDIHIVFMGKIKNYKRYSSVRYLKASWDYRTFNKTKKIILSQGSTAIFTKDLIANFQNIVGWRFNGGYSKKEIAKVVGENSVNVLTEV